MKSAFSCLFFFLPWFIQQVNGQVGADALARHRIAVFVPLYLDSAFDPAGNYSYDKNFPKFLNPGLEFYEGLSMAADSLRSQQVRLDLRIYDTRSAAMNISRVLADSDFQQTELIIGHVLPGELHELAAAAGRLKVPFINVNFPNDGGVTNNPELVILNSTLKTHCEALYKFIQRNYATSTIYLITKKGGQEDRIRDNFAVIEKTTASVPLKMHQVMLQEPFTAETLLPYLDSLRRTICIVGSLEEGFVKNVCTQLSSVNKKYATKIFGMPTWDNIVDFSQPQYADQEIYYTTPFYINPADSVAAAIQQNYRNRFYSRPSDMVFRGYETLLRFGRLLQLYGHNLSGSIGEKKFKVFNDFDIQPVFLNKQNMTLDYFENRKLYMIKKVSGNVVAVY